MTESECAVVMIEALCGHDDHYFLRPGEVLQHKGGQPTLCLRCNEKAGAQTEQQTRERGDTA